MSVICNVIGLGTNVATCFFNSKTTFRPVATVVWKVYFINNSQFTWAAVKQLIDLRAMSYCRDFEPIHRLLNKQNIQSFNRNSVQQHYLTLFTQIFLFIFSDIT